VETLADILEMTKAELLVDSDSEVAAGGDSVLKIQIANQQRWLARHYTFAHLQIERPVNLVAGTLFYTPPADLDLTMPVRAECYWTRRWWPVELGIPLEAYNDQDPENNERLDPVRRWQQRRNTAGLQLEVWPLPASATRLKLTGQMVLPPLAANSDTAELDGLLLAQWTAAKLLARMKSADAPAVLAQAQETLRRLIGRDNTGSQVFSMRGPRRGCRRPCRMIVVGGGGAGTVTPPVPGSFTADSMVITADSMTVTADSG
jgi:hypothetical protein